MSATRWRNFLGSGSRVRHTRESLLALKAGQVAVLGTQTLVPR